MSSPALAQDFAFNVSPAEMEISRVRPGESVDFQLTVTNIDVVPHVFTITAHHPPEEERREGREALPHEGWVSFSPGRMELPAGSSANVTVAVAIPPDRKWAGRDWEIWLGVAAESTDMLAAELHVRLLVSTRAEAATPNRILLPVVVAAGAVLAAWAAWYYFRHRGRPA